jgi:hypothetical protein
MARLSFFVAHEAQGECPESGGRDGHLRSACIKLHEFQNEYEWLAPVDR